MYQATRTNAAALAAMFGRPTDSALYLPQSYLPRPDYQAVAADIDKDGEEDKYEIRLMPLTSESGKSLTVGNNIDVEVEPAKWSQVLEFPWTTGAFTDDILVTGLTVNQVPHFPFKGAIPASTFARDRALLFDLPFAGPGRALTLTLKNTGAATITWYGAALVRTLID